MTAPAPARRPSPANVVYVYPWDVLGDPAAPGRLAALGVDAVALTASYHSVRAATPYHPRHRVVDAHAACYVPVRARAWTGRLVPATPSWTPPDAFVRARDLLRAEGLAVHAWTVLTHNSLLGSAHPGLTVRNAFGDAYPYALCPSRPEVVEYCRTLVREVVELGEPDALTLEACGPLGFRHPGAHEKTEGADWRKAQADLLSLCFCTACAARYPAGTRARVRAGVDGPSRSMEDALGDLAPAVRQARIGLASNLRRALVAEARRVRPGLPINLHGNSDPWAAGSFSTVAPPAEKDVGLGPEHGRTGGPENGQVAGERPGPEHGRTDGPKSGEMVGEHPGPEPGVDVLVGNCWGTVASDTANLARLRALADRTTRIGAYLLILPPRPADSGELLRLMRAYVAAGAQEFHIYHGGLASAARLEAVTTALTAFRTGSDASGPKARRDRRGTVPPDGIS
ncbi:hypothetical protein ACQPYK_11675 [Streptosporangium sp. CA-135522]|uniref:hypothetical protein n=1 Tax=Streptosporangium sp. CA-135522 TaxID=3240072 RepID=UPI003D8BBD4D